MSNTFYNEILIEHNLHPTHKHELPDANLVLEGVNPSCGDDIWLPFLPLFYSNKDFLLIDLTLIPLIIHSTKKDKMDALFLY